ncbi:MAG TPA: suppressor of fused domain protein [Sphingomonas sp.]|nr:suppressor of fused domain protein [Sphingomonas sp.]
MPVSESAHASAQELADTFGGSPTFVACRNEGDARTIDLALCADSPSAGVSSLGTVTLADHDLGHDEVRLQIIAVYPGTATDFSRAVGTCALNVVQQGWPLRWGACHPDVLTLYGLSKTLAHLYYVPPFSWPNGPKRLTVGGRRVEWLQAIPVSEAERAYAEEHGAAALEKLLADTPIDITDFDRSSIV